MASYGHSQSVSHKVFWALVVIAAVAIMITPSTVVAKKIVVGGGSGWTVGFDYQAWANGKTFHVGDELVFKYHEGAHNVLEVSKAQYSNCDIPSTKGLTSGHDTITLNSPGKSWYICGVGGHCSGGQKLVIDVKPKL